jgi:hypothetical protein
VSQTSRSSFARLSRQSAPQAVEFFLVLRLVLRTQPRSGIVLWQQYPVARWDVRKARGQVERQRRSVIQPRVAPQALPWVSGRTHHSTLKGLNSVAPDANPPIAAAGMQPRCGLLCGKFVAVDANHFRRKPS